MLSLAENPSTGEPYAGKPPVRFGGRGGGFIPPFLPLSRFQLPPSGFRLQGGLAGIGLLVFNVVFCDAHVESLKANKLFGLTEDVTRRWNRDNEPHTGAWIAK